MQIHQTLHGYRQGHNLIVGSIQLASVDDDRMKLLSDWSEYTVGKGEDSAYITCYPLTDGRFYVIAKTWYAEEMQRPGCVWTHSLIINIDELPAEFDFRDLDGLFRRPQKESFDSYTTPISIDATNEKVIGANNMLDCCNKEEVKFIYNKLINKERCLVYRADIPSLIIQRMLLNLIQFLPLQILKDTTLCSGCATVRKINDAPFNLQFSVSANKSITNTTFSSHKEPLQFGTGINYLVNALLTNDTEVSQMVRMFSNEATNAVTTDVLGTLLYYLDLAYKKGNAPCYEEVITLLEKTFPLKTDGTALKLSFLSERVATLFTSKEDYYYCISTICPDNFMDWSQVEAPQNIISYCTTSLSNCKSLGEKLSLAESLNTVGVAGLKEIATRIDSSWQNELARNNWRLYNTLVSFNPNMLLNDYWLSLSPNEFVGLLYKFADIDLSLFKYWGGLLTACLRNRIDLPNKIATSIVRYYPNLMGDILNYAQIEGSAHLSNAYIDLCKTKAKEIITFIKDKEKLSSEVIRIIEKSLNPKDNLVRESGSQPWKAFYNADNGNMAPNYYVYMFVLAHNWIDELSISMLKRSFYQLHQLMGKNELDYSFMASVIAYMDDLPFWQSWDNCKKLRKGLARYLHKAKVPKPVIKDFTPSMELNKQLQKAFDKFN